MDGIVCHKVMQGTQCLSEQEAWDIAMAWQPQLQGKVRLVVDRDGPVDSIIANYAWVRIDEPHHVVHDEADTNREFEALSIKRAVMVTWAALAASPGFGGSENGAFWKRVISQLQEDTGRPRHFYRGLGMRRRDVPDCITDAYGFFDLPGHTFPRFLVQAPAAPDESFCQLFTVDGPALTPRVNATVQSILVRLESVFGDVPRPAIDVCVSVSAPLRDITPTLGHIFTESNSSDARALRFRICETRCRHAVELTSRTRIDEFLDFVQNVRVRIDDVRVGVTWNELQPSDIATGLRALFRLDGFGVRANVASVHLPRERVNDAVFRATMSALPFATSIHSLSLDTTHTVWEDVFEQVDLPWVGYAIFHPRAESSSWKHLAIDCLTITERSAHVLSAMARGNNLLALVNGTPPDSTAYYSAELRAGTIVQREPNPASEVLFIAPMTGEIVDVCGISSLERGAWAEWVAAIIPAFGLGWVRQHEVFACRAHEPAIQSLTGLRLQRKPLTRDGATSDPPEVLLHFLSPLGFRLTYLDISSYTDVSEATLNGILRACPSIKVLKTNHSGALWSGSNATGRARGTQLEELELIVQGEHPHVGPFTRNNIVASLRNLRALRIQVPSSSVGKLQVSQASIEQLLAHATSLRYFHWQNRSSVYRTLRTFRRIFCRNRRVPYAVSHKWTMTALLQLELTNLGYLAAEGPINAECAIAFLSVLARKGDQGDSALGRLVARGVLANIFQFATSPTQRCIHIEPDDEQLKSLTQPAA